LYAIAVMFDRWLVGEESERGVLVDASNVVGPEVEKKGRYGELQVTTVVAPKEQGWVTKKMRPKPQAKDNAKGIKEKEEARGDVNCDVDLRG
jgi:hypothetical protein